MRLRTESLLAILPLFLLVGAAGAGATWLLKSRDWRQGVEEQARGMAAGIAEFIADDQWIETGIEAEERLHLAEARLARWHLINRIRIWNADQQVIHQWSKELDVTGSSDGYWLSPQLATDANAHAVGKLVPEGKDSTLAHGGAIVWNHDREVVGWVECEIDAAGWDVAYAEELKGIFKLVGGIVILGTLMALFFNRLMLSDIQKLIRSAREVGGGKYVKPTGLKVSELQDLSASFSVVDSLTHENRMKFRRSLIENEIFRTNTVLVDGFRAEVLPDIDLHIRGRRVISRLYDQSKGVRWHGGGESSDRGWLWQGAIVGNAGLNTAVQALAVSSDLESMLLRQNASAAEALKEVQSAYDLDHISIISWESAESSLEKWTGTVGSSEIVRELFEDDRFLTTDLISDLSATIDIVWSGSRKKPVDDAFRALEQFLGKTDAVISIIIGPSTAED